jgi:hypothetical protein
LWDQNHDELATRALLEEGKLNLLMRILHTFKTAQRDKDTFNEAVGNAAKRKGMATEEILSQCRMMEQSAGLLLQYALRHVESLQVLDVPELMEHCAETLADVQTEEKNSHSSDKSPFEDESMQPTVCLHYINCISAHMEQVCIHEQNRI